LSEAELAIDSPGKRCRHPAGPQVLVGASADGVAVHNDDRRLVERVVRDDRLADVGQLFLHADDAGKVENVSAVRFLGQAEFGADRPAPRRSYSRCPRNEQSARRAALQHNARGVRSSNILCRRPRGAAGTERRTRAGQSSPSAPSGPHPNSRFHCNIKVLGGTLSGVPLGC
jgi:hypothetical protein